jgi:hypothetical protein
VYVFVNLIISKKVFGGWLFGWHAPVFLWRCRERFVESFEGAVQFEDGCDVSAPVTVVWG